MRYLLAIDQGTTSSRAVLFNRQLQPLASAQEEFPLYYPADGWVEQQGTEIWASVQNCVRRLLAAQAVGASDIAGIGITNQRETTLLWDRASGQPIGPAIVWQDRRTADFCARLRAAGHEAAVRQKTGLLLDPYFSASKIRWLLDNIAGARAMAEAGELAFGTVDSWLLWQLSGGRLHATDATNASRTSLFNIHSQQWDPELLALFEVPASLLPAVHDSAADYGQSACDLFDRPLPLLAVAGDQQAALIGQGCLQAGQAKCTFGTGAFLMVNTGDRARLSSHRLLTTLACRLDGQPSYAMEGAVFVAGAAIQWLRDGLQLIDSAAESGALAAQLNEPTQVTLVPAFTGLGAPYWDPEARGACFGLTRDTGARELAAATLQAIALQTWDLVNALAADGICIDSLRIDGGMSQNPWFCQFLAGLLDLPLVRPAYQESTVLGAARLAAHQLGWRTLAAGDPAPQQDRTEPAMDAAQRARLLQRWQAAVAAVQAYAAAAR